MNSLTFRTIGLFFCCVTDTCLGNIEIKYQYKTTHHYSSSLTPFRSLYGLSLNACVYQCSIRKKCKSVNYKSRSQACELNTATGTPDVNKNEPSVYIEHDIPNNSCGCADHEVCTNTATKQCSIEECEPLSSVNNGKIYGNMNKIGSKLKVTCDSGFVEKEGRMYTKCLDNGTWQFLPECIKGSSLTEAGTGWTQSVPCITSCVGLSNADYQSCKACNVYASCNGGELTDNRACPVDLVWDDNMKRCERTSATCS